MRIKPLDAARDADSHPRKNEHIIHLLLIKLAAAGTLLEVKISDINVASQSVIALLIFLPNAF